MSTSAKMWTWGEVCLLRTMCSAIFLRIGVHGATWSPSALEGGETFGACDAAALEGTGGAGTAGGGAAFASGAFAEGGGVGAAGEAPPETRYDSTSFRVTRPSMPVPGIFDRSRPCSAAIRATTGVIRTRPVDGGGGGAGTEGSTRGGAGIGGSDVRAMWPGKPSVSSSHFGAASGAGGDAAESVSIFASTVWMGTVSPGLTRICVTRPADGEGISASTLSVEISSRGWSLAIRSPTSTSHFTTTPSTTLSPSWGITTSMSIGSRSLRLIRGEFPDRLGDLLLVRQDVRLHRRGERRVDVPRPQPHDRPVQLLEAILRDPRGDLSPDPSVQARLVDDQRLSRLPHGSLHRRPVDRQEGPQVDHLDVHLRGHVPRRLHHRVDRGPVGDDGEVPPLLSQRRLPDGDQVLLRGNLFLDPPIEELVLEVDHRVVVPDGGFEQPLRVVRRRRGHHLEAGDVAEPRFRVLGVVQPAVDPASRRPPGNDRAGGLPAVAIAKRRRRVHDLVEAAGDEVDELHLEDRAHPLDRQSHPRPDDQRLGDGHVDHPVGAVLLLEPRRRLEGAAQHTDILPHQQNIPVPLQLLVHGLPDRLDVGDEHGYRASVSIGMAYRSSIASSPSGAGLPSANATASSTIRVTSSVVSFLMAAMSYFLFSR